MSKRKRTPTKGEEAAATDVIEPMNNDVLFGRGDSINRHQGNKQFRELVDSHKRVYLASRFKQEKRMIAVEIMSAVRNFWGGRFLAKDSNGQWQEVGDARAREKTLQALREKARSARTEANPHNSRAGWSSETMGLPHIQRNAQPSLMPELAGPPQFRSHQPDLSGGPSGPTSPTTDSTPRGPGFPPAQTTLAPAGSSRQVLQSGSGSLSTMIPPNASYTSFQAPTGMTLNAVSTALPHSLGQNSNARGGGNRSPLSISQSTFVAAPLRPPPALPSTMRPSRRGNMGTLQSNLERASQGQGPERRQARLDGTEVFPANLSLTPRGQVPNDRVTSSPVSAGTFDALQRVAFPESPGLDFFLTPNSANHPFSPRRFPPSQDPGLQPSFAAVQGGLHQLDSGSVLSPRQHITSQPSTSQQRPLSAITQQQREAAVPHTMGNAPSQPPIAMQGPTSFLQQPHENAVHYPIQTSLSPRQQEELPMPNRHANQVHSPSLHHFMGHAIPPSARATIPRGIPLPRASLAPRSRQEDRQKD